MQIGDLVRKRWGLTEVYQQNSVGIIVGKYVDKNGLNPHFHGYWIQVLYTGRPVYKYRPNEFEVVSEARKFSKIQ